MAFARGQVTLTDGTLRLLAREMEINLGTGDFKALDAKAGFYPWITEGSEIMRENDLITSKDAFFYLLDRNSLEPNLSVRQLTFDENASSFKGIGVALRIGNQKIGMLPSVSGKLGQNPFRLWTPWRQKRPAWLVPWHGRRMAAFRIVADAGRTDGL